VGSLPRPDDLIPVLEAKDSGQPYDRQLFARRVSESVREIVDKQAKAGIDAINDGEHSKSSFTSYPRTHLDGFEPTEKVFGARDGMRDALAFPAVYQEQRAMYTNRLSNHARQRRASVVCTGPIKYVGQADARADVENLRRASEKVSSEQGFMTALAPTNVAPPAHNGRSGRMSTCPRAR
jgi:5-methyltetrahydropteroyltriglutamate--homocysteine methyltransferase